MKQIIDTALEAIEQKKRNINYMLEEKRRLDSSILKEVETVDALETEIRMFKENESKQIAKIKMATGPGISVDNGEKNV